MLTVTQAARAIAESMPAFAAETVKVDAACGRILQQAVVAERNQPPFDRVMMDGIAINFDACKRGTRKFLIQGTQQAGDPVQELHDGGNCIEIMTGAVLPSGADCVIPVEHISIANQRATLEEDYSARRRQFVHPQGSDHRQGHTVLGPGAVLSPMDIAIIASSGLDEVKVSRLPAVSVISTGNELVPPGQPIEPHQVRLSNGPALVAMLTQQGFADTAHEHLADDPGILESRLATLLCASDVLILSGGVSMGKADYVPQVLANLGVAVVFHKISQRPGKPMWFGMGPAGQTVFALPGNPVSTLVCCRQYVLPALLNASGRELPRREYAVLSEDVTVDADLTCFLPVRLSYAEDGRVIATAVPTNTSGDFTALHGTDGYVELASEASEFPAGSTLPLHRWDNP